jgi:hypothetical protein
LTANNVAKERTMKTIALVAASLLIATAAFAQAPAPAPAAPAAAAAPANGPADTAGAACQSTIGPKKLHGAALTSSSKKCCTDAATAAKLHGAAATSFVKKCMSDVTG